MNPRGETWLQRWRRRRCEATGHRAVTRTRRGWKKCHEHWRVAVEIVERRRVCRRCGVSLGADVTHGASVQSLTLNADVMRKFDNEGQVFL